MATAYAGVDMSFYQDKVDYKALAAGKIGNSPVAFAMLRSSYGMSKDIKFDEHYKGCKAAGLHVGVYHWLVAQNLTQAREEAQWLVKLLSDYKLDYPVALDFEDGKLFALRLSKAKYTAIVRAFMEVLVKAGYRVILYTNPDTLDNRLLPEILNEYDLWLAHWTKSPRQYGQKMWQYAALGTADEVKKGYATAVGTVPGLKVPCDVNWSYVDYAASGKTDTPKPATKHDPSVVVATKYCKTAAELTAAENQLKALGYDYKIVTTQ